MNILSKPAHAQNIDAETKSASTKYTFQVPYNTVRPIFPPRGVKSGHCIFNFSISPYGKPKGINSEFCTDAIFEKSARKALEESRFRNYTNSTTNGVKGLVKFRYKDERGRLIPASSKLPDLFAETNVSDSIVIALLTPQDSQGEVYYNTASSLNVRSAPNGIKLGDNLAYGQRVVVYEKREDWLRISTGSEPEQWISEKFVSTTKPVAKRSPSNSSSPSNLKLSDAECGRLRIRKIVNSKTQKQFDAFERQLTRGGCNSQREARKKQWDWIK